jgi:phosphodiesterase/alkaline phosphatase D-like protein
VMYQLPTPGQERTSKPDSRHCPGLFCINMEVRAMKKYLATLIVGVALAGWGMAQNGPVQITQPPKVEHVTSNSAIIAWSTNVNSSTLVRYGTDQNSLSQSAQMPWGGLTHRVTLKNLQPGTTYFYQAVSDKGQGTGSKADAPVSSFQTSGGPMASNSAPASPAAPAVPTAAPVAGAPVGQTAPAAAGTTTLQAGPVTEKIEDTSATVWALPTTPQALTIKYGTNQSALNQSAPAPTEGGTEVGNEARLTGLQPSTVYFYQVADPSGRVLDGGSFQTLQANFRSAKQPWITRGPEIEYITGNKAVIAWSTSTPTGGTVMYGTDPNAMNQSAPASPSGDTNRATLSNLQPNTQYYFFVKSGQSGAQSFPAKFKTTAPGQQVVHNKQNKAE